jgi:hypothetical protein
MDGSVIAPGADPSGKADVTSPLHRPQKRTMSNDNDFATASGNGGETHQQVPKQGPHDGDAHLTNQGIRISDNQNSLRSGERGPTLLEDFVLREKIFHFDHERIPERIVRELQAAGVARRW